MKKTGFTQKRRDFLKTSALGAAGVAASSAVKPVLAKQGAWSNGMQINDQIDNLRVVYIHDDEMTTNANAVGVQAQASACNKTLIEENMDKMAMALAQKGSAEAAWATIIRKPDSKEWGQVKAAIKVNAINEDNTNRIPVINKICKVLNDLGVISSNITIYDALRNATGKFTTGNGLVSGVNVSDSLGGWTNVDIPGSGNFPCGTNIVNGTFDILVNIAVNKGHDRQITGYVTLCMKNHYGTFNPQYGQSPASDAAHEDWAGPEYVLGINKTDAIIGGNPPRQQICIVDSLWAASRHSPDGSPEPPQPNYLIMGTFAPVVDYQTVKKVREPVMGATHFDSSVARFLTDFGYSPSDLTDDSWVNAADYTYIEPSKRVKTTAAGSQLRVSVEAPGYASMTASIPFNAGRPVSKVSFHNARGSIVRVLNVSHKTNSVRWDGRDRQGKVCAAGMYTAVLDGQAGKAVKVYLRK